MDLGLQGKRALETGSSAGIGAAIAEALAAEGSQGETGDRRDVFHFSTMEISERRVGPQFWEDQWRRRSKHTELES
jgi:NAD(P)-dependent dehydrogenase (short-subunit alcohol dehydrogenase family)